MSEKILVTSALPYANGPIHFGHIAGAYLPADIFVRFKRMCGDEVIYICGTDDHGVPITISAEARGVAPEQHVAENHDLIEEIFSKMRVEFSNFSGTSRKDPHYALTQEFYTRLTELGHTEKRTEEQFFCDKCARFLADRYITGACPHCGHEGARGDECGGCGKSLEAAELVRPACKVCGAAPAMKPTAHWYLRMGDLANWLVGWLEKNEKDKNWRTLVLNEARKYLDEGLHTRAITRDISWGVPLPSSGDPDAAGKVIYVWFDAPIGYISSTMEYFKNAGSPDRWKEFWKPENPGDVKLYHFIGKDNIFFHAVMFPIMCHAMEQGYKLTDNVVSNAFLNLEGRQFSKSEGWYIDPLEFLEKYPADSARYYLCSIMPESSDSEFRWDDFAARHNELANIYGNIVHRVISFTVANFDGKVPGYDALKRRSPDSDFLMNLAGLIDSVYTNVNAFSFRRAIEAMMEIARSCHKYIDTQEPWRVIKTDPKRAGSIMNTCLFAMQALAVASYPFLPDSADKIWRMLGNQESLKDYLLSKANFQCESFNSGPSKYSMIIAKASRLLEIGRPLVKPEILFTRIEKKQVEEEKKKLQGFAKKKEEAKKKKIIEAVKPPRGIEDFQKWDLRVALIKEAEPVPKSNKMVKLLVDIGVETRTVMAGIAAHYKPEELVGRRVILVANLEPKALMGVESCGMVLAVDNGERLCLLAPDGDAPPGARVS